MRSLIALPFLGHPAFSLQLELGQSVRNFPAWMSHLNHNGSMIAWLLIIAATAGHFGLHLAIYNRLNATGLRRKTIKRTEKLFVLSCLAIPVLITWNIASQPSPFTPTTQALTALPWFVTGYGVLCIASLLFFGIPWLMWRPIFGLEWTSAPRRVRIVEVAKQVSSPLALSLKCRWEARIPGNQIFELAIEEIELPVPGLPANLDGLRIAHLSDLHFTGDISPAFTEYAIEQANHWQPEIYAITGDIVDKSHCIPWLQPTFKKAHSVYGNYFILGNHDTRVSDPGEVRREMETSGWTDVGGRLIRTKIRDTEVEILGNESPWFGRPSAETLSNRPADEKAAGKTLPPRFLFSHSPDQLGWARRHGVMLMLAGHTHGGQGRLPLVGPLLSPSWHGSRYASGDFWKAPTVMHVSRGLSGVHLLRINCRPELSLITLRSV
jgi:uncharacterized protein